MELFVALLNGRSCQLESVHPETFANELRRCAEIKLQATSNVKYSQRNHEDDLTIPHETFHVVQVYRFINHDLLTERSLITFDRPYSIATWWQREANRCKQKIVSYECTNTLSVTGWNCRSCRCLGECTTKCLHIAGPSQWK